MAKELGEHLPGRRRLRARDIGAHMTGRVGREVVLLKGAVRFADGVNVYEFAQDGRHSAITGFTDFLAHPQGAHAEE